MTSSDTSPSPDEPQLFGSFATDSDQQQQAKKALRDLKGAFRGTPLADTIDGVLSGDKSMRDLMRDPQMARVLEQTATRMQTEISEMPPEKLAEMKKEHGL